MSSGSGWITHHPEAGRERANVMAPRSGFKLLQTRRPCGLLSFLAIAATAVSPGLIPRRRLYPAKVQSEGPESGMLLMVFSPRALSGRFLGSVSS